MEPFPSYRRRLYLVIFILLFIFLFPAVIFYADGWRFIPGVGLLKTGGIFIDVPLQDATVTLNGANDRHSTFLQRSFYIDDLTPGAYVVRVEKEGYRPWARILVVEPQLVTDAAPILLPNTITLTPLSVGATSTKSISSTLYTSYLEAFATSSIPHASSTPLDMRGEMGLFLEEGFARVRWLSENHPPSVFCETPLVCRSEITLHREGGPVVDARFFGGGVVYQTKEGVVYFTEIDIRLPSSATLIVAYEDLAMRIIDDVFLVRADNTLYEVGGL